MSAFHFFRKLRPVWQLSRSKEWPVSCEREFSSIQREVSIPLQPGSAFFLLCKRDFFPFAKESRSHDTGHYQSHAITLVLNTFSDNFQTLAAPVQNVIFSVQLTFPKVARYTSWSAVANGVHVRASVYCADQQYSSRRKSRMLGKKTDGLLEHLRNLKLIFV
jgi:hypothetical protein